MLQVQLDLNTGDNQTANGDLTFKIYEGGNLYHTAGSANSDPNVSISGTVVTIVNVPSVSGSQYSFTVSAVDEAGNESGQSNVVNVTATLGTLIYDNDFTSGLNGVFADSPAVVNIVNDNLVLSASSGVADKSLGLNNTNFIPPDNVNFVNGTTYAFEIDIVSSVNVVSANNTYPDPDQTPVSVVPSATLRWERSDMSNGSFQLSFSKGGAAWVSGDQVEISALRVYRL